MSTRSIECQIARGQISRYLSGDAFSPESLIQLEGHVSGCTDCKQHLTERKSALQSMLGKPQTPADVEPAPAPEAVKRPTVPQPNPTPAQPAPAKTPVSVVAMVWERLIPKSEGSAPVQPAAWKSVGYSVGLALVLGAMSLASKNMDRVFGPKTTESTAIVQPEAAPQEISTKPKPKATKPVAKHLKEIQPIDDPDEDAAKAARAARNAVYARKAKEKLTKKAAQRMPGYQKEPAPKLSVPGNAVPKPAPKVPSMLRKAPPGAPKVAVLAKRAVAEPVVKPKPKHKPAKMLEVEAEPRRRSRPISVVKKHAAPRVRKPKASPAEVRVYAP